MERSHWARDGDESTGQFSRADPTAALGEVCEIALGLPLARHQGQTGVEVPVVRLGDLDDHMLTGSLAPLALDLSPARLAERRLREGDVLLTARAPAVRTCLVGDRGVGAVPDANILVLRCRPEGLRPAVLWAWLQSRDGRLQLHRMARVSTATVALGVADVARLRAPMPPDAVQRRVEALVLAAERAWFFGVLAAHHRRAAGRATAEALLAGGGPAGGAADPGAS